MGFEPQVNAVPYPTVPYATLPYPTVPEPTQVNAVLAAMPTSNLKPDDESALIDLSGDTKYRQVPPAPGVGSGAVGEGRVGSGTVG